MLESGDADARLPSAARLPSFSDHIQLHWSENLLYWDEQLVVAGIQHGISKSRVNWIANPDRPSGGGGGKLDERRGMARGIEASRAGGHARKQMIHLSGQQQQRWRNPPQAEATTAETTANKAT